MNTIRIKGVPSSIKQEDILRHFEVSSDKISLATSTTRPRSKLNLTVTLPSEVRARTFLQQADIVINGVSCGKADDDFLGLTVLQSGQKDTVDIVAVHGLNGHAFNTWATNNVMWLRDFLPDSDRLGNARIMTFGYDSGYRSKYTVAGIRDFANELLSQLNSKRTLEEKRRPLIFVCHSLGGIVVKQAMCLSANEERYQDFSKVTYAILFFGTPHRGSEVADYGVILEAIAKVLGVRKDLIKILKSNSDQLLDLANDFRRFHRDHSLRIATFYETGEMVVKKGTENMRAKVLQAVIVPKHSALLNLGVEEQNPMNTDHVMLCRFSEPEDTDYLKVLEALERHVSDAPASVRSRFGAEPINSQCLRDLRVTDPRCDKDRIERSKDDLQRDVYRWVLNDQVFKDWRDRDDARLVWIKGDPGKGKTMMMIGLINEMKGYVNANGGILSFFFCQAADPALNNSVSVLRGLIYLLVDQNPVLLRYIEKLYATSGKELFEDKNAFAALSTILSDILQDPSLPKVYLMIDALDECETGLKDLLKVISGSISETSDISLPIIWIVASRNRTDIEEQLRGFEECYLSLEFNAAHISQAVDTFIDFKVLELEKKKKCHDVSPGIKQYLRENSEGTFLYVALVCKELEKVRPGRLMSAIKKFPRGLIRFYGRMLEQVLVPAIEKSEFENEHSYIEEGDARACRKIISVLTLVYRPLHVEELSAIAGLQEDQQSLVELVGMCAAFVVNKDSVITFVHQSARDYFRSDAGSRIFLTNLREEHCNIATRSILLMSKSLKKNICELRHPGTMTSDIDLSIRSNISSKLGYASCYWIDHLEDACKLSRDQQKAFESDMIYEFLQVHLLHWLEVLSLIGMMGKIVSMLEALQSIFKKKEPEDTMLLNFVADAVRWVLDNRGTIADAPLQTYSSALIFSPTLSIVKTQFQAYIPTWIDAYPSVEENWSFCSQTLKGRGSLPYVKALAFSPDSQLIALIGYIPDSQLTAPMSYIGMHLGCIVWDLITGTVFAGPYQMDIKNSNRFFQEIALTFSPGGEQLIVSTEDGEALIYDIKYGSVRLNLTYTHCRGPVSTDCKPMIDFSPDGRLLVSVDEEIRIYNAVTGVEQAVLSWNRGSINCMAFSLDSRILVLVSKQWFSFWDVAMAVELKHHTAPNNSVRHVSLSFDGKLLAFSTMNALHIWDTDTWTEIHHYVNRHKGRTKWSDIVSQIAFSPNNKLLTSNWTTTGIHVSTPAPGNQLRDVQQPAWIDTMTNLQPGLLLFSPDGKLLAIALFDGTLRVYDITRSLVPTSYHELGEFDSMAVSTDGMIFCIASLKVVKLWHAGNRAELGSVKGSWKDIRCMAIQLGGRRLAIASGISRCSIEILDLLNGDRFTFEAKVSDSKGKEQFLSVPYKNGAMAFFPAEDRVLLASAFSFQIDLWNTAGKIRCIRLPDEIYTPISLDFSSDGRLALVDVFEGVLVLSINENNSVLRLNLPKHTRNVTFSRDGSYLRTERGPVYFAESPIHATPPTSDPWAFLRIDQAWVVFGTKKLLRLPLDFYPAYPSNYILVKDNILIIRHKSKRISVFEFDLEALKADEKPWDRNDGLHSNARAGISRDNFLRDVVLSSNNLHVEKLDTSERSQLNASSVQCSESNPRAVDLEIIKETPGEEATVTTTEGNQNAPIQVDTIPQNMSNALRSQDAGENIPGAGVHAADDIEASMTTEVCSGVKDNSSRKNLSRVFAKIFRSERQKK